MSKRQQLLDTAAGLFVKQGVDNTATAQISKEAGVATGTLFYHFKNKDELICALVLNIKENVLRYVQEGLDKDTDYKNQMRGIWLAYMSWAIENPIEFQFRLQVESLVSLDEATQAQMDTMTSGIDELVLSGLHSGHFKALDEEFFFAVIGALVNAAAGHFIERPELFEDDTARELMFQSFWDSLSV